MPAQAKSKGWILYCPNLTFPLSIEHFRHDTLSADFRGVRYQFLRLKPGDDLTHVVRGEMRRRIACRRNG